MASSGRNPRLSATSHFILFLVLSVSLAAFAALPDAPTPQNIPSAPPPPGTGVLRLTLAQAEQLAFKNNPQITVSKLLTLAEHQVVRETRATELPTATGSITAVDAHNGTRITAGVLNNPSVFERAGAGVTVGQLITDFGRTRNLVASSKFREQAQQQTQEATAYDVLLTTDQSFYAALEAQAQLVVAQQTVNARQTTVDQVQALTQAKLKSDLDLSFANVNLAQAKLLLLDAQDKKDAAFANLNAILGFEKNTTYLLIDESDNTPARPPANGEDLVTQALRSRPDLIALDDQWQAAQRFSRAERDLNRPAISALGAVGGTPVRADQISTPWYGAVGVNLSVPVFNGFLFSARANEAAYRSSALEQQVRDLRDRIARDVRTTWLQANTAYQRLSVTAQLLQEASLALDLAQTRYKLGLSSIVELSQAQLQQTAAQIGNANARYDYLATLAALNYQLGR
ncbi:MAG TPA: TolC family protein [Terriglobales bacterium]|nr:TolC family protein [Terriglobales bacterium]